MLAKQKGSAKSERKKRVKRGTGEVVGVVGLIIRLFEIYGL